MAIILSSVGRWLTFFTHLVIVFHVVLLMYDHWAFVVDSALIFSSVLMFFVFFWESVVFSVLRTCNLKILARSQETGRRQLSLARCSRPGGAR